MTAQQIQAGSGATTKNANAFLSYINDTCTTYGITTPVRQLCFLAQTGHESAGLFYTQELASGNEYNGRADLGNTQPGDGPRYKGRGLIQITGRANYTQLGKAFNIDLVDNPTLLGAANTPLCSPEQLKYAAMSAGWFWNSRSLNKLADLIDLNSPIDAGDNLDYYREITRKINGGYNGLADRVSRFKAGVESFAAVPATT